MLKVANQRYECLQCGKCCRCFRIALTALEIEAIAKLDWPHPPPRYYELFQGRSVLKHKDGGDCVFLDEQSRCRMHALFGAHCKPLSCKAYPFEFLATFGDEVTVMARFDCPAVLAGRGARLTAHRQTLEYVLADRQLHLGTGFSAAQLQGLQRGAVECIRDFLLLDISQSASSFPALLTLTRRMEKLGPNFLNDLPTLRLVLPSMRSKAQYEHTREPRTRWSWPERIQARAALIEYLRRDEALSNTALWTRLGQAFSGIRLFAGGGNAADFHQGEHPDFPLRKARLFDEAYWNGASPDPSADRPWRRFLSARLETLQFFGAANHGATFFAGLCALLQTSVTAQLLARLRAAAEQRRTLSAADWGYATAAIDHCFGRRQR